MSRILQAQGCCRRPLGAFIQPTMRGVPCGGLHYWVSVRCGPPTRAEYGELIVSHFQALVLVLFNNANSMSCQEIGVQTAIPGADLHRTLQSLALHKYVKLLTKEPKTREVGDQDIFSYNAGFTHKMYRIAVTQISPKEQHEEEASVERRVFEDRQHEVDAAVVRIMKVKKTLSHQQLLQEVFASMSFPVTAADVKRRVES